MKMSDIGFLKTKLTSEFKNLKTHFPPFCFQKPSSAVWEQFFTLSHSQ